MPQLPPPGDSNVRVWYAGSWRSPEAIERYKVAMAKRQAQRRANGEAPEHRTYADRRDYHLRYQRDRRNRGS